MQKYKCFMWFKFSYVMRKSAYAICEQQRCRSACVCVQSDQHLCCSLLSYYNTSSFYIQTFKTLTWLCRWAGRFVSYRLQTQKTGFLMMRLIILLLLSSVALQNLQNDLCAQRRLRSACVFTQCDQSLDCPHEEALSPWLSLERTA